VPILPEGALSFHVIPTGSVVADLAASMASVSNVRTSSPGATWSLRTTARQGSVCARPGSHANLGPPNLGATWSLTTTARRTSDLGASRCWPPSKEG